MAISARSLVLSVFALAPVALLAQAPAAPAGNLTCALAAPPDTPADTALAAGDSVQAEALFTTQLAASPSAANYVGLIHAQIDRDKLPEAITTGNAAVAALPKSAEALAALGDALFRAGQLPEANSAYLKALTLDLCSAPAHLGEAHIYELASFHQKAAKEVGFAHKLAPRNPAMTAAYLRTLPAASRAAAVRAFLASHPALPPAELTRLDNEAAILEQHLTCTVVEPSPSMVLPLQKIFQNGHNVRSWGLKARLNDTGLQDFELDSSVDGIVLNTDDAAKAHVHPLTSAPAAPGAPYMAIADNVRIGDVNFGHCPVSVVPNNFVDNRNSLVGTNFFRDHLLHIDYVAMTLTLTPLPALPPGSGEIADQYIAPNEQNWTHVYLAGPTMLVSTAINKKGPYLFALDTGIVRTVVAPATARKELSAGNDRTINLQGYSGAIIKVIPREGGGATDSPEVSSPSGKQLLVFGANKVPVYRFAASEIPDDATLSFDITPYSHARGIEVSGLLSFNLLSYFGLDLNYRDGLANIVFDQNRRYHVRQNTLGF